MITSSWRSSRIVWPRRRSTRGRLRRDDARGIADAADPDARKAIATLRNALDIVLIDDTESVTDPIIERARQKAEVDIARLRMSSLTDQQMAVLKVLADIEPATSGTIYDEYERRIDDPSVSRTVRGWLSTKFPSTIS